MFGIYYGVIDLAFCFRAGEPFIDVETAGTMATLASDAMRHSLVLALYKSNRLRIAVVARHAPIRHETVEAFVLYAIAGAEIPLAGLRIPRERQLVEPAVDLSEIGAGGIATAHHKIHPADESMRSLPGNIEAILFLIKLTVVLESAIVKIRRLVAHRPFGKVYDCAIPCS